MKPKKRLVNFIRTVFTFLVFAAAVFTQGCPDEDNLAIIPYSGGPSEQIVAAFSQVCDQGVGVSDATPYSASPGVHPIVIYSSENPNTRHIYNDVMPAPWIPQSMQSVELVACVGPEVEILVQTCEYTNGEIMRRFRHQREAEIYIAHDASLLETHTISGSTPDDCPGTITGPVSDKHGSRVSVDEVFDWLQTYVEK